MKTILVPTDFSESAETALHFAITLARQHNAKLVLMHVIADPIPISPQFELGMLTQSTVLREQATKNLRSLSSRIAYAGGIDYEYQVAEGGAVDQIKTMAERKNADLIVMGMSQKGGLEKFVFGSTATEIVRQSTIPVLVIPGKMKISRPITKVTYATNYLPTDIDDLRAVIDLVRPMKADVTIMHISTEEFSPETEVRAFHDFVDRASTALHYEKLSAEFLTGLDVARRLEEYLDNNETDLLAMTPRDRGFFAEIFGKSLTRKAVKKGTVPVVVLHHPTMSSEKKAIKHSSKAGN